MRCLEDLKSRGLRTVFYPFILMDASGLPWRGRITYAPDVSSAATTAVDAFLGSAATSQFTRDATNLTVSYSGAPTDWTLRRMILHYANLVILAGGVDLFLLGSELRGLETIRGPGWSKQGSTGGDGKVTWDYPFVDGLAALADDVRATFDAAGLTKDPAGLHNLITYSADWSDWMGFQHPGENGQWPHLDQLWGHDNIDLVALDNYMPLSDWTTGDGGLDAANWSAPKPGSWPPDATTMNGLGLAGPPTITSKPYLKANIEGGEKFNWFYSDGDNLGRGFDPLGTDLQVSLPAGDRLTQSRNRYYAGQQILANKQIRWWWNNTHQAVYDDGDGAGWAPHGPLTRWVANSKSITFAEYGVPTVDKGTNQPNVFYDPRSSESFTPYWSTWDPIAGGGFQPTRDDTLAALALARDQRILGERRQQRNRRHDQDDRAHLHVGVELGRAAVSGLSAARRSVGRRGALAVRPMDRRQGPGAAAAGPAAGSLARHLSNLSAAFDTRLVGPSEAVVCDARSFARLGPQPARRQDGRALVGVRADLRPAGRRAGRRPRRHRRLFQRHAGDDRAVLVRAARPFAACRPAARRGRRRDDNVFTFQRSIGAYAEPLAAVFAVTCVYNRGVPLSPTLYTIDATGFPATLTFATAPEAGAMISADFSYYCLCRFADDFEDVEEFMAALFRLKSLKLRSVKL